MKVIRFGECVFNRFILEFSEWVSKIHFLNSRFIGDGRSNVASSYSVINIGKKEKE
jgi:hypothetical protein